MFLRSVMGSSLNPFNNTALDQLFFVHCRSARFAGVDVYRPFIHQSGQIPVISNHGANRVRSIWVHLEQLRVVEARRLFWSVVSSTGTDRTRHARRGSR